NLQLLHQDQRLEKIAEIGDPYRRLNGVLARLNAGVAPADQTNSGLLRRLPRTLSPNVKGPAVGGQVRSTAFPPADPETENLGNDSSANAIRSSSGLELPRRAVAPVMPADVDRPAHDRLTTHS